MIDQNKQLIMITNAASKGAYWVNSKYIIADNWEISKRRFTPAEQTAFETEILNPLKNKPLTQTEINKIEVVGAEFVEV